MKVYVVTSGVVYDFDEYANFPKAFYNKADALEELAKLKKEYTEEYVNGCGWVSDDCEMSFDAYLEGSYSSHNCFARVQELKVEGEKPKAKFSVWVGGGEVNDYLLTEDEANELAETYRADGYDDVQVVECE